MTISELVEVVKGIAIDDLGLNSFYVGNTWDMAGGKADNYPNLWFELPVLVDYNVQTKLSKQFTFSIDILMLAKLDNVNDEVHQISHCEEYADKFLAFLKTRLSYTLLNNPSGLTLKSINADDAVGVRLDIRINTPRVCPT